MRISHLFRPLFGHLLPLALFAVIVAGPFGAEAQDRWALVLGVSEYESEEIPTLKNTLNDSRTIAAALNDIGFRVYYLENGNKAEIEAAIGAISTEQPEATVGVLYFAGHALQLESENYLLPSDVSPTGRDFLRSQGVPINRMIAQLNEIGTETLVVILDSCRNSPFPDQPAIGTGLALVDAPPNTIVAYSTAPGAVAFDGTGANSPYTAALASALAGPEQDIRDVLRLVRARVRLATGGAQTPWYIDNSRREITLRHTNSGAQEALTDLLTGRVISLPTTAWRTISDSSDPRDFEQFTELFPEDNLTQAAKRQIELIQREEAPDFPLMELKVEGPGREIPGGLISQITACDVLATGVGDVTALVDPVPHDLVNTRAALRACIEAVRNDPSNGRLVNHLARVLRIALRFDEALHYFQVAADLGNPTAYAGISAIYRQGIGVEPDYPRALEAARQGALAGSPQLRLVTGVFYREGWGAEQSYPEARRWITLAMQGGYSHAYVAYGDLYRKGLGVEVDDAEAVTYYRKAAELGSTDAMNLVGMAYMRGQGVERDTDTGINWLVRASEEGNPHAAYSLGRAFQDGWGVKRNLNQALAFFRLSAQRNYLGAHNAIGDILRTGTSAQAANLPEAYANYIIAREAAGVRDTLDAQEELADANARIAEITGEMTAGEIAEGEKIAADWIAQFGLLDFNLVNE